MSAFRADKKEAPQTGGTRGLKGLAKLAALYNVSRFKMTNKQLLYQECASDHLA